MSGIVDPDKLDTGMDSGVCPSPDENYQSYYDAFPSLAGNNIFSCLADSELEFERKTNFRCPVGWKNKRGAENIRRTSSSSPPSRFTTLSFTKSFNSAPSPTSSDHTPSKRPKLLTSSLPIAKPPQVSSENTAPLKNVVETFVASPSFKNDHPFCLERAAQPQSCPDLSGGGGTNNDDFKKLHIQMPPNFCCPQISQSVDPTTKKGGTFSFSAPNSVTSGYPPKFVVPKCFKAASWPTRSDWRAASDVPFWSCGEWFCTMHKGVQFGLLTAKVGDQAAKLLSPDPVFQQKQAALAERQQTIAEKEPFDEGDTAYRDEYFRAWIDEPKLSIDRDDRTVPGGNGNQQQNAELVDDVMDMPDDDYFYDALVSDDNDLPPVQIHPVGSNRVVQHQQTSGLVGLSQNEWKCDKMTQKLNDPYAVWSNGSQIEIPSSFDQLKAANSSTVNLDTYWPPETTIEIGGKGFPSCALPSDTVPEFDPYYLPNGSKNADLTNNYLQEVGFCMPKLDISPQPLKQQLEGLSYANNSKNGTSLLASNFGSVPKVKTQHPLVMPSDCSTIHVNTAVPTSVKKSVAVPISPDTHFVPIRSESMEAAYFVKPGYHIQRESNDKTVTQTAADRGVRGLAYVEETGYYVYLDPEENKSDDTESPPDDVCDLNANNCKLSLGETGITHQPKFYNKVIKKQPMKISKSMGSFCGSSASRCNAFNSLPLKFRASKPGKMVQTEEKYFIYCDDRERYYSSLMQESHSSTILDDEDTDSLMCDLDIDEMLAVEAPLEIGQCESPGAIDDAQYHHHQSDPQRNQHSDCATQKDGGNMASVVEAAMPPPDDGDFEIWACKTIYIAAPLVTAAAVASSFDTMLEDGAQSRWSSSGDIKERLATFSETMSRQASTSSSKFGSSSSNKPPLFYRGATSLESSSTGAAAPSSCGLGALSHRSGGAEVEMWLQQDQRDEEMLLRYVSNISLISPLDINNTVIGAATMTCDDESSF